MRVDKSPYKIYQTGELWRSAPFEGVCSDFHLSNVYFILEKSTDVIEIMFSFIIDAVRLLAG